MKGISRWLVPVLVLLGLTGCVTEVNEYKTHIAPTKVYTSNGGDAGFNFRTIGSPQVTDEEIRALARANNQPDPHLVNAAGVVPQFEPYSRTGNKDYEVYGRNYKVWKDIQEYSEEGTASWYGPGFHGKFTSNGEVYDQYSISAAHKNLPIPCYVRVTNKQNGRAIIVRINDRGPFHDKRILDLSFGAAQQLGIVGQGIAQVRLDLIHPPRPDNADEIIARHEAKTIQLLATQSAEQARKEASRLSQKFGTPVSIVTAKNVYRLHMGPMAPERADQMLAAVHNAGLNQAYFIY